MLMFMLMFRDNNHVYRLLLSPYQDSPLKYLFIAILFTAIGYGLALLLSTPESGVDGATLASGALDADADDTTIVDNLSPDDAQNAIPEGLDPASDTTTIANALVPDQSEALIAEALDADAPDAQILKLAQQQEEQDVTSLQAWEEGSYLKETDLLSMPGISKLVGFRIGPPVPPSHANAVLEAIPAELAPVKVRFLSANKSALVLIVAGQFSDLDQAYSERRPIQPTINKSINFIYLPDCLVEPSLDDEGYACGPPEQEDDVNGDAEAT